MFTLLENLSLQEEKEALVVGVFEQKNLQGILKELNRSFHGQLESLLHEGDISTKKKRISKIHTLGNIGFNKIYFVGLGKEKELERNALRKIIGALVKQMHKDKMNKITIAFDSFISSDLDEKFVAQIFGEAISLANYQFENYKQKSYIVTKRLEKIEIYTSHNKKEEVQDSLEIGFILGRGTNTARHLVNLPPNMLTATDLTNYAIKIAHKYNMDYQILEKEDMERLGMGAILAVNKGSVEPPKLIVLKYQGKEKWEDVLAFVGKGITYDSGGYSLKSRDGMVGMKTDMGGAAAVLGAMEIIGERKLAANIMAVIPATDNMVNGQAFKPDDVITSMSGKTIEVLNTDAEGRLVLCDAITYAKQQGASYIIDVATLTGGVIVALGTYTTGAMTNNESFYEEVLQSSYVCEEPIWLLPYFDVYKNKVRNHSKIADLSNSPGREAHAIMAGAFLGEFAEDTPWVHLDIAGTATTKAEHDLGPAGATGVMTRTLANVAERLSKK